MASSLRYLQPNSLQNIVPPVQANRLLLALRSLAICPAAALEAHLFCLGDQARGLANALLGKCNGVQRGAGNAPTLATPQKARFRGASGRLDLLGKGFPERGGSATKWYHSPAPLRGGPAGRSAGELLNKPEERDGLRDLPAGPGQPVQMPGMRGRALFALYEGAPEESLLAARTASAGPLPLPGRRVLRSQFRLSRAD